MTADNHLAFGALWGTSAAPTSGAKKPQINHRMLSICLISLAAFAIIISSSVQLSDGAALNPIGKHRSNRDRGKLRIPFPLLSFSFSLYNNDIIMRN